ncbi:putative retrotransposon gag domain-containing protein [Helianthus annuus]|nr:putative retrotransposon gag domain-containing protein [Helianthus annuus]
MCVLSKPSWIGKPLPFNGTEGAIGLLHWIEKVEAVFAVYECPPANWVKFATGTLEGNALSWWKAQIQMFGLETANATAWEDFKDMIKEECCHRDDIHKLKNEYFELKMVGSEIEAYTKQSNDYAALCPNMSRPHVSKNRIVHQGFGSRNPKPYDCSQPQYHSTDRSSCSQTH